MTTNRLLSLVLAVSLFHATSCSTKFTCTLSLPNDSACTKVLFGHNKDVIKLERLQYHRNTFFLYHDFSFDRRIIVSIENARIWYKNYGIPFNFIGGDFKKDSLHIAGDENILTACALPFNIHIGDTVTLKLENFIQDENGQEYTFEPIYFVAKPYVKRK